MLLGLLRGDEAPLALARGVGGKIDVEVADRVGDHGQVSWAE